LREEIYRAYVTRASSGDLDNTAIIDSILKLRLEKAKLLNYNNYAEVSLLILDVICYEDLLRYNVSGKHGNQNGYCRKSGRASREASKCFLEGWSSR
jgi:hypothetical protein